MVNLIQTIAQFVIFTLRGVFHRMIKELKPNYGDEYSWHEVNCFFRAWSIVLQSYHASYFDNFLQAMFLNWTFFPESIAETEHDDFMLESNANVLSPLLMCRLKRCFTRISTSSMS